jgi:hypothetical protein
MSGGAEVSPHDGAVAAAASRGSGPALSRAEGLGRGQARRLICELTAAAVKAAAIFGYPTAASDIGYML